MLSSSCISEIISYQFMTLVAFLLQFKEEIKDQKMYYIIFYNDIKLQVERSNIFHYRTIKHINKQVNVQYAYIQGPAINFQNWCNCRRTKCLKMTVMIAYWRALSCVCVEPRSHSEASGTHGKANWNVAHKFLLSKWKWSKELTFNFASNWERKLQKPTKCWNKFTARNH